MLTEILLGVIAFLLVGILIVLVHIRDNTDAPKITIEEDPESMRRRLEEMRASMGATIETMRAGEDLRVGDPVTSNDEGEAIKARIKPDERMTFGGLSDEERRAMRRARRIDNCTHHADYEARARNGTLQENSREVTCQFCTGVAPIIREEGQPDRLGEFK